MAGSLIQVSHLNHLGKFLRYQPSFAFGHCGEFIAPGLSFAYIGAFGQALKLAITIGPIYPGLPNRLECQIFPNAA